MNKINMEAMKENQFSATRVKHVLYKSHVTNMTDITKASLLLTLKTVRHNFPQIL